ncbi:MAG: hypothetical protein WAT71_17750 [Ignavibacteria bacterium]
MKSVIAAYLLILLFITPVNSNAQNFEWVDYQTHSYTINPDYTSFVSATDQHGNSFTASAQNSKTIYGQAYLGDLKLKKLDPSGNGVFDRMLYGKLNVKTIETDKHGNIYLTGIFMDTLIIDSVNFIFNTGSGLNLNYFLIKLSDNGNFIWKKNVSEIFGSDYRIDALKIKGDFFYAGISNFTTGYLKKYDLNGNELMSISQQPVRGISGIAVDDDGNIFTAGACSNGNINFAGQIYSTSFFYNVYFAKYDPAGANLWVKFVEDITFSNTHIACDNSGNLIASGDLFGAFTFGNIQAQGNQWVYDFFLTKIDPSGNFLWLREVPNTASITGDVLKAKRNSIAVDKFNNIYFTGFLRGSVDFGNDVQVFAAGTRDILIMKFDTHGNSDFGKTAGGTFINHPSSISLDSNSNIFISGNVTAPADFGSIHINGTASINSFLTKISYLHSPSMLDLSLLIEGFYDGAEDKMRMSDTVTLSLRESNSPYVLKDFSKSVIDKNTFNGYFNFSNVPSGNYYLQIKHRNSIETWSSLPVNYTEGSVMNYSFITSDTQAFGNNLKNINISPVRYGIFSGDTDQDGAIDLSDQTLIDNDSYNFATGYIQTDVNGDSVADLSDAVISDNNGFNFVSKITP